MGLSERLKAVEKRAGDQNRPVVVVWPGEDVPEDVPENALIILVEYTNDAPGAGNDS